MDQAEEWKLEKYARSLTSAKYEGMKQWETLHASPEKPLHLILTKEGILKVYAGQTLLEYWNLQSTKYMRTYIKESCLLFLCKSKGSVRKWRIQFSGGSAADCHCSHCFKIVNSFLRLQLEAFESQAPDQLPLSPSLLSSNDDSGYSKSTCVLKGQESHSNSQHNFMTPALEPQQISTSADMLLASVSSHTPTFKLRNDVTAKNAKDGADFSETSKARYKRPRVSRENSSKVKDKEEVTGENLPAESSHLIQSPHLEQLVKTALLDPNLPALVEAVHRITGNM